MPITGLIPQVVGSKLKNKKHFFANKKRSKPTYKYYPHNTPTQHPPNSLRSIRLSAHSQSKVPTTPCCSSAMANQPESSDAYVSPSFPRSPFLRNPFIFC